MLYFFYDLDEMPFDPNDLNACIFDNDTSYLLWNWINV